MIELFEARLVTFFSIMHIHKICFIILLFLIDTFFTLNFVFYTAELKFHL